MEAEERKPSIKVVTGEITIPTLNIESTVKSLCTELHELSGKAESVSIFNTFSAYKLLRRCNKQKEKLRLKYDREIEKCYANLSEPVSGPGFSMAFAQAWSTAKGTAAILKLQSNWYELAAVIDRKYAYAFAIIALYVSIFSVILTTVFGML